MKLCIDLSVGSRFFFSSSSINTIERIESISISLNKLLVMLQKGKLKSHLFIFCKITYRKTLKMLSDFNNFFLFCYAKNCLAVKLSLIRSSLSLSTV